MGGSTILVTIFFVISEEKSQATQKLPYSDVDWILKKEKGFPKKGKFALGVIGVLMVMGLIANGGGSTSCEKRDSTCQLTDEHFQLQPCAFGTSASLGGFNGEVGIPN